MIKFLKIFIKWLPAIISALRELLKLFREYRQHRITMKKLKKDLTAVNKETTEKGSAGIPEREPE